MLTMAINQLEEAEQLMYFEVATNDVLQKLLNKEITTTAEQILALGKRDEEDDSGFHTRFQALKIKRDLLSDFLEANQSIVAKIQNLQQ